MDKYKSVFTDKEITAEQHLAELMCVRKAKKEGDYLQYQFWYKNDKWLKYYKFQITSIHQLTKIYPIQVLLSVLKGKEFSWVFSLRYKPLIMAFDTELGRYNAKMETLTNTEPMTLEENLTPQIASFGRQSLKSKLD